MTTAWPLFPSSHCKPQSSHISQTRPSSGSWENQAWSHQGSGILHSAVFLACPGRRGNAMESDSRKTHPQHCIPVGWPPTSASHPRPALLFPAQQKRLFCGLYEAEGKRVLIPLRWREGAVLTLPFLGNRKGQGSRKTEQPCVPWKLGNPAPPRRPLPYPSLLSIPFLLCKKGEFLSSDPTA